MDALGAVLICVLVAIGLITDFLPSLSGSSCLPPDRRTDALLSNRAALISSARPIGHDLETHMMTIGLNRRLPSDAV
jgi:hypothetical protein